MARLTVKTRDDGGEALQRDFEVEDGANLLVFLRTTDLDLRFTKPGFRDRFRRGAVREPDVLVEILSGSEGTTPPTPSERRRFGDDQERFRCAGQVGLLPGAHLVIILVAEQKLRG